MFKKLLVCACCALMFVGCAKKAANPGEEMLQKMEETAAKVEKMDNFKDVMTCMMETEKEIAALQEKAEKWQKENPEEYKAFEENPENKAKMEKFEKAIEAKMEELTKNMSEAEQMEALGEIMKAAGEAKEGGEEK